MKRHASMNRIYRLVWSHVLNAWVAVAERARGRGKQTRRKLAAVALALCAGQAQAAPIGGQVVAGSGSISQSGATTTINQISQNLSLSWQGFNTGANETVNFVQPSASAIAVNRIADTQGSQFFGHLNANGQVWLINPNGILFGLGSQVNVGGLVASTLDVSDADLNSASRSFAGSGAGSVANDGTINGGYVAFIGNSVSNRGSITANGGTVALGAGRAVTLTFAGNSLVHLQVEQNALNNLAENGGLIRADGGRVLLTAGARNALLASVVNNTGIIEARSVQNVNGSIVLDGGNLGAASNSGTLDASGKNAGQTGGTVKVLGGQADLRAGSNIDVSGDMGGGTALVGGNYQGKGAEQNAATATVATGATISADAITHGDGGKVVVWSDSHTAVDGSISARGGAKGGNGGQVETSGKKLDIGNNTRVATLASMGTPGNWLLDPVDFIIYDPTDPGSQGHMNVILLNNALALGSVTIQTGAAMSCTGVPCFGTPGSGDITVAATTGSGVAWTANNNLTLSAYRNVNINGTLNASGGGSIILRADNTGTGTGTVNIAPGQFVGGTSYITTALAGSTTIYTNTPTSTTGYKADSFDFFGTFNVYQLVRPDTAGVVNAKTYDGTTAATLGTPFGLAGSPVGATLAAGTASFADRNAGIGKTVNFSGYSASGGTLMSGGIGAPYFLSRQPTATGTITAKALTIGGITAGNKTYDGATAATVSTAGAVFTGKIGGDVVTVSATGSFADKNVATGKTVTLSSSYGGADAGNYTIAGQASATANITPAALAVSGITANNKTYDATTAATANTAGAVFSGKIGGDVVTVSASGSFADKNVATGKTVTLSSSYGGADAGNYTITGQISATANITAKAVTVSGITAGNKTYDGATVATVSTAGAVFTGMVVGDTVTVSATGSFADKNAANGKTVTLNSTYGGADLGNYTLTSQASTTANIAPAAITVSGITANNKTYDATTAATANTAGAVFTGKVGADVVTVSATGSFADKNVANGKTVTLASTYGGADAGNYTITGQASTTANIIRKAITVSGFTVANKVYDATTAVTINTAGVVLTGLIGGDVVRVLPAGVFSDKNVGTGKTVTLGISYMGADNGNYSYTAQASTTANITAKVLTLSGITASNKVYDGTTSVALNTAGVAFSGLLGADVATLGGAGVGSFADKNAGNGKAVTVSGYTLGGADAGNYTVGQPTGLTANIAPKAATVSGITANNKTYDATTAATVNTAGAVFTGKVGADVVTVSATGSFADKNVATGKTVTLASSYGGADAGNYTIAGQASATANITPAALTVSGITANNKTYDATTAATANTAGAVFTGKVGGDVVTVSATGSFADKNAGNGKTVTLSSSYGGADAGNYTIAGQASATANITPAKLTVTGVTASNKVYDGATAATLNTAGVAFTGLLGADLVTLGGAGVGSFADKNAGTGKAVIVSGYTLGGADAGNYTVAQPTRVTADITPAAITVSGITANNKTYDASTVATINAAGAVLTGLIGGDAVSVGSVSGSFADKNVGTGKAVALSTTYTGGDTANYTFIGQTGTTADIAPAAITVSGLTASNKTYDATTAATINTAGAVLIGKIGADAVTVSASGSFTDKNAGNGKAVTVSGYTLGGADAGNYTVGQPTGLTANIAPKAITVSGITANNKTYDASTVATINAAGAVFSGKIGGDAVSVNSVSGSFADKNVGTGKAVALSATYTGADTGNYTITGQASTAADIAPKALSLGGITANNKTYDGTTAATINTAGAVLIGKIGADAVTVSASGSFADKNAGSGKAVTVSGYMLGGADAGNYTVAQPTGVTADITPAALTVSGITANNKTYDATTVATINAAGARLTGLIGGDAVSVNSVSGSFADKNVGTGKAVALSTTYTGGDTANYTIIGQTSTTADIAPAAITVSGLTASNKTYDATTAATINTAGARLTGLIGGDAVSVNSVSGSFADANVGAGKTVTLSATYTGADTGNYTITGQASTAADITPAMLTVIANNASKRYDGSAYLGGNGITYTGFVGADNAASILSGALSYGGSSQGATAIGSYAITPGGFAGNANYAPNYVNGTLTISPGASPQSAQYAITLAQAAILPPQTVANPQAPGLLSATAVREKSGDGNSTLSIGERGPVLQIKSGGVRLPLNIADNGVFQQVGDERVRRPQDAVSLNGMKDPQL